MVRNFAALGAAALLAACTTVTHFDGDTLSLRHEHIGPEGAKLVAEKAAELCKGAGKTGAVHVRDTPVNPAIAAISSTIATFRCT